MEISILNCGVGNLNSIKNSLNYLKIRNKFVNTKKQIKSCNSLILPGVGSFFQAIKNIKKYDLYDSILEHAIIKQKPILGICLGMQLLFSESNEIQRESGFGLVKGKIREINKKKNTKIHDLNVGWQDIQIKKKSRIFNGIQNNECFYFLHSYTVYDLNKSNITANYTENNRQIVAAICKKNIFGVQFHPEKSGLQGLKVLKNFAKLS